MTKIESPWGSLSPAQAAGQLLLVGTSGKDAASIRPLLDDCDIGGFILFSRNVESSLQVMDLLEGLQNRQGIPRFFSIDQEGGRVARLRSPFTEWPTMRELALACKAEGSLELAVQFGRILAKEMLATGFNWDHAPVADVDSNPQNPVIGDRAFSSDPAEVSQLTRVIIEAMQAEGIMATAKHFPGHGDTDLDSHFDLPHVQRSEAELRATELPPFIASIEARVASIMTAHVIYHALDAERPASLSPRIVQGWLRDELGYEGLIVTDDLEMKAVADRYSFAEAGLMAVEAGADIVLVCHQEERIRIVHDALSRAIADGAISPDRISASLRRIAAAKQEYIVERGERPNSRCIGCSDHRALADRIRTQSQQA